MVAMVTSCCFAPLDVLNTVYVSYYIEQGDMAVSYPDLYFGLYNIKYLPANKFYAMSFCIKYLY